MNRLILVLIFFLIGLDLYSSFDKYIYVTFTITDWNNNPAEEAIINIETSDISENKRQGENKFSQVISYHNKKKITKKTLKLRTLSFNKRIVTIVVTADSRLYYKKVTIDNVRLEDGQSYEIKFEKDWDYYNNEERTVYLRANLKNNDSLKNIPYMNDIFSQGYNMKIKRLDLENGQNDFAELIFSVDSTCSIYNRIITRNIDWITTDWTNDFFNQAERNIKQLKKSKCLKKEKIKIIINWFVN